MTVMRAKRDEPLDQAVRRILRISNRLGLFKQKSEKAPKDQHTVRRQKKTDQSRKRK